jgi:hypothetical protein
MFNSPYMEDGQNSPTPLGTPSVYASMQHDLFPFIIPFEGLFSSISSVRRTISNFHLYSTSKNIGLIFLSSNKLDKSKLVI